VCAGTCTTCTASSRGRRRVCRQREVRLGLNAHDWTKIPTPSQQLTLTTATRALQLYFADYCGGGEVVCAHLFGRCHQNCLSKRPG
jgi:hypothetical protein